MSFAQHLFGLDVLVFSSHKTATQTVVNSLNVSGARTAHCHRLSNIGLDRGELLQFLRAYRSANGKVLRIVSIFRDPLDRLISSFFQSLEEDYWAWTIEESVPRIRPDPAVADRTDEELRELFLAYVSTVNGWGESLDIIVDELGIEISDLRCDKQEGAEINHLPDCELYLFRFDKFVNDLPGALSRLSPNALVIRNANASSTKPYAKRYADFISNLRLPAEVIEKIYGDRRELMRLFFSVRAAEIVAARIRGHSIEAQADGERS